jgi:hypothetical protein
MKTRAGLALLLAVTGSHALAGWVEVASDGQNTIYADPATIRKEKGMVKMWCLSDKKSTAVIYRSSPPSSPQFLSTRAQLEFDCKGEKVRTLYTSSYSGSMAEGNRLYSNTDPSVWEPIPPGTIEEALSKRACAKR